MRLYEFVKPHSWLWFHVHLDACEVKFFQSGKVFGPYAVDGQAVEEFLDRVAYESAHALNNARTPSHEPPREFFQATSVLFDGLYAQQTLRWLVVWGIGTEAAAPLLAIIGIVIAWRTSRCVANVQRPKAPTHQFDGKSPSSLESHMSVPGTRSDEN